MADSPLWRRFFWVPGTLLGWWSLALALGFFMFLKLVFVWGDQPGHDRSTLFSDPIMALTVLAAGACGISAGMTSGLGIFRKRERSLLVFATLALGALVAWFVSGEIASGIVGQH
jgi:hypothetical protein